MKLRGDQSYCPAFNSLSGQILTPPEGRGEISKSRLTILLTVLKGLSMKCRFATLATAILIGGAFMVGHANAQYYGYPPNSPYAQPRYGPPGYAMPPDMDDDYPMYNPREDGAYSPPPPRSAAAGPQGGPQYAPPFYGPPPYGGPSAAIPDDRQGSAYGPRPVPWGPPRPAAVEPGWHQIIAALPPEDQPETGEPRALPPQLQRQLVDYPTREQAGTIIIDTPNTFLYLVLGRGKALRYGIGVGREGFTWSGTQKISKMSEWPDWFPPSEMIQRQPYLPRVMAGGRGNPLGARALYLGNTLYRIHGTNQPSTIGQFVSSGCIRLTNEDIEDLYRRVRVGTHVVVLPARRPYAAAAVVPR
jgi:lipoprotein-anchoring transpeptidase ErfK/SrfK